MPPCAPDAASAPSAEAGTIKLVICDDNLTVGSVATAADITFYPKFSPDRHSYVVHVADDVSEVVLKGIYPRPIEMSHSDATRRPAGRTWPSTAAPPTCRAACRAAGPRRATTVETALPPTSG